MKLFLSLTTAICLVLFIPYADGAADSVVVFNEVQYNPPGQVEEGEWLEFFNQMGIKVDLSGWKIDGIGYTFPSGTILDPGSYLVVAKSPSPGQFGPFSGSIDNGGEHLILFNQSGRLMDEINFSDGGLWPAVADGSGASLAKNLPYTASGAPGNWTFSSQSGGTPGNTNFPDADTPPPTVTSRLIVLDDDWRYNESGADLGSNWAAVSHPPGGDWRSGPGGLGRESGTTIPIGTTLTFPGLNNPFVVTYYFEREFNLGEAQLAGLQSLNLRHAVDDGAVIYINGSEIFRVNMPAGVPDASTLAASGLDVDELSATLPVPSGALVAGTNRVSVEVHQERIGSSDIVFGLELDAEIAGSLAGAPPRLKFNEITPADASDFWIELLNAGAEPLQTSGITVSTGGNPLREYQLPEGELAAGSFLLLDEQALGFRPAEDEKIFLHDAAGLHVLDGRKVTGRLRGSSVQHHGDWLYPITPTPGATNAFDFNADIVISEIAYNPPGLSALSAVPATFDNFPLVAMSGNWRCNNADESLDAGWASVSHPAGGNWKQARGPIGRETGSLPEPLATAWSSAEYSSATVTYYYEADFTVPAEVFANADSLEITHQVDDGAVFYLNGTEVGRFNMPVDQVDSETLATPSVSNAVLNSLEIDHSALLPGENRISVEVHQSSRTSSDTVFGLALDARVETSPAAEGRPFRNSDNQWIEVANRGDVPVDISGWQFADGVDFTFPGGSVLAPGEHASVARDAGLFASAFPDSLLLGEFSGTLSRSGERLELRDAGRNPVDILHYKDGGSWPGGADGGGSSLELRDLNADNSVGGSWAASDESGRTEWRTYSYRKVAGSSRGPDNQWREFNMGLLGSGEILIDDVSVIEDPGGAATQKLNDTTFNNASSWRLRGNHRHGAIINEPGNPGNKVLRIVTAGPTEHMHNQIETTLAGAVSNGRTYEISFRARWISGSNQLHTRLYFNRCAGVSVIDRPDNPGSPSEVNSREESNIGPSYSNLKHSPVVPSVGESARVSVQASDPDDIGGMSLFYSVNGGNYQQVTMGTVAGGRFEGGIPGQSAGAVVAFYVRGNDTEGGVSQYPSLGSQRPALYEVDDGKAAGNGLHNFRIVMSAADVSFMHVSTEVMSNDRLNATVIDSESRVYYGCGVRLKSSERGRDNLNRVGYNVKFPADNLYRGVHEKVAIDRSQGQSPGQRELLFDIMMSHSGGVLSRYYDLIRILAPNNALTGSATLQLARYDEPFLDSQFEDGADGRVYEYELIYYPTSESGGLKRPQPDRVVGVGISNLGDDPEAYRWFFLNKINREADDFTPIINYAKHFSKTGNAFEEGLEDVVDVDSWLRGMAYAVLTGSGDNAAAGSQHNGAYYANPRGQVMFLPHDMDFSFSTSRSIFANSECSRLTANASRRRIYLGHLQDIITTTYNNSYMSIWTSHFAGLDPAQNWSGDLSYMNSRSSNVLSQINSSIAPVNFSITTPSPLVVSSGSATVSGEGWVNVRSIRVQGNPDALPVTWLDGNSWRVNLPAPSGSSAVTLEALDFSGNVVGTKSITINNTTLVSPGSVANLVISELMYHPEALTAQEVGAGIADPDQFEFIEVMNISGQSVILDGVRFVEGVEYDFALGTILAPEARLVIARDRGVFLQRYPAASGALAAGEFQNDTGLSNGGERLRMVDAAGAVIRDFTYNDRVPWPVSADGQGHSLVLIAPELGPDHGLAHNWRSSVLPGGSPGEGDAVIFEGEAEADNDGDGMSAFLEHALGGRDTIAGVSGFSVVNEGSGDLIIIHPRNLAADDALFSIEVSSDLVSWEPAGEDFIIASDTPVGDGSSVVVWRASPVAARIFVRLRVDSRF
ncbi:MAG: hypothetical protein GY899_01060 [Verrucomicrobiaceae bacterium]|nr:hypothetical protein [Verrucomicrobiaceae bacterium]